MPYLVPSYRVVKEASCFFEANNAEFQKKPLEDDLAKKRIAK